MNAPNPKPTCSVRIPYGMGFHSTACSKPVKVERDGKPYCTIHDPERLKAKAANRQAADDQRMAEQKAVEAKAREFAALLGAGRPFFHYSRNFGNAHGRWMDGLFLSFPELEDLIERLKGGGRG